MIMCSKCLLNINALNHDNPTGHFYCHSLFTDEGNKAERRQVNDLAHTAGDLHGAEIQPQFASGAGILRTHCVSPFQNPKHPNQWPTYHNPVFFLPFANLFLIPVSYLITTTQREEYRSISRPFQYIEPISTKFFYIYLIQLLSKCKLRRGDRQRENKKRKRY